MLCLCIPAQGLGGGFKWGSVPWGLQGWVLLAAPCTSPGVLGMGSVFCALRVPDPALPSVYFSPPMGSPMPGHFFLPTLPSPSTQRARALHFPCQFVSGLDFFSPPACSAVPGKSLFLLLAPTCV